MAALLLLLLTVVAGLLLACTGVATSRAGYKSKEVAEAKGFPPVAPTSVHHKPPSPAGGRQHGAAVQQHKSRDKNRTKTSTPRPEEDGGKGRTLDQRKQQQHVAGWNVSAERDYIPSNCSRCRMLEETLNLTKEAIKQQILSKLGLKQPPNITGRALPRIPPLDHLLDMYGMQNDAPGHHFKPGPVFGEAEDDYHAKTEKVITFAQTAPKEWGLSPNMEVLYFKFSDAVMDNKVVSGNLWVYLEPSTELNEPINTMVHVYKVCLRPGLMQDHVVTKKVEIKSSEGGWVTVDIRKLVTEWFRNSDHNFGIVVQAYDTEGRQLVLTSNRENVDPSLMPFLEVYTMDESKRRTKRMIGLNCEERSTEVRCCRYPLTVDFEEFGWDWIIAPKKYEANYCSGECPFVFLQKYPHTHLVQQANPSGSAGPCCAPRKMSPISMLYFDSDFMIIYGLLPGMVVDRCGCS